MTRRNHEGVIGKAGSSLQNVLKVQVSLVDPERNWEGMDEAYNTFYAESEASPVLFRRDPDFGGPGSCCRSTASRRWTERARFMPFGLPRNGKCHIPPNRRFPTSGRH